MVVSLGRARRRGDRRGRLGVGGCPSGPWLSSKTRRRFARGLRSVVSGSRSRSLGRKTRSLPRMGGVEADMLNDPPRRSVLLESYERLAAPRLGSYDISL